MSPQTPPAAPRPTRVSGALPGVGHSAEFRANPALFMLRAWRECGELAEFDLGGAPHLLMSGPAASEAVFRAPDDQLSPSPPYRFMVRVFGEGIQFGAPLEIEPIGEDGDHNTAGILGTAMRVVNAIPAVCAHAPGVISTLDLPVFTARGVAGRVR